MIEKMLLALILLVAVAVLVRRLQKAFRAPACACGDEDGRLCLQNDGKSRDGITPVNSDGDSLS